MFEIEDELLPEAGNLRREKMLLEGLILEFRRKLYKSLEDGENRTTGDWLNEFDNHFSIKVTRQGNI